MSTQSTRSLARESQISQLRVEQTSATAALSNLQAAVTGNQTTTGAQVTAALDNSQVLSVTPLPYSKKKKLITYGAIGLVGGLALGLTIVVVRALVSDRLRRRDDIAYALDAPVKLSVSTLGARRPPASAHEPTCSGSSLICTAQCQEVPRSRPAWLLSP